MRLGMSPIAKADLPDAPMSRNTPRSPENYRFGNDITIAFPDNRRVRISADGLEAPSGRATSRRCAHTDTLCRCPQTCIGI
jgi:hypothetical protein